MAGPGEVHYANKLPDLEQNRAKVTRQEEIAMLLNSPVSRDLKPGDLKKFEIELRKAAKELGEKAEKIEANKELNPMTVGSEADGYRLKIRDIKIKLEQIADINKVRSLKGEANIFGRAKRAAKRIFGK